MKFDITTVATVLSVSGALLVTFPEQLVRFIGFVIWIISNTIWTIHFKSTNQTNPMILFMIYLVISLFGAYNSWL